MSRLKALFALSSVLAVASAATNASVPILTGTTVTTGFGTFDLTTTAACACNQLAALFPNGVLSPNSTNYTAVNIETWDIRTDLDPACIFQPETADEVAKGISVLSTCDAQFAIRGGGHMNVSIGPIDVLSLYGEYMLTLTLSSPVQTISTVVS